MSFGTPRGNGDLDHAPRVAVLLAVYNGMAYLPEQVDTILGQEGVAVRIVASDDGSSDGSLAWIRERAAQGAPITVLPVVAPSGSASANFLRLVAEAEIAPGELVGFADQDDRWHPDKLSRHAAILTNGADVVSSNVTAFDERGRRRLIKKDWPQRRWDALAEAAGPGSTYLFSAAAHALLRRTLLDVPESRHAPQHDVLAYVVCRSAGLRWHIDAPPSVDYRQHADNVLGANQGLRAARTRLRMLREHSHRRQTALYTRVAITVAEELAPGPGAADLAELRAILGLVTQTGLAARVRLSLVATDLRRRPRDRVVLFALILLGVW